MASPRSKDGENRTTVRGAMLPVVIVWVVALAILLSAIAIIRPVRMEYEANHFRSLAHTKASVLEAVGDFNAANSQVDQADGALGATLSQFEAIEDVFFRVRETGVIQLLDASGETVEPLLGFGPWGNSVSVPEESGGPDGEVLAAFREGRPWSSTVRNADGVSYLVAAHPTRIGSRSLVIVAAIQMSEVQGPFLRAGLWIALLSLLITLAGAFVVRGFVLPTVQRMHSSEASFRQLVEDSGDAIAITSVSGKVLRANQACLDMFDADEETLAQTPAMEFWIDPCQREGFLQALARDGRVVGAELSMKRSDGSPITCLVTATLRKGESGKPLQIETILKDITALKAREEALRKSEANYFDLFHHSPEMLISAESPSGIVRECNTTLLEASGYTRDEIVGRSIMEFCPPDEVDQVQAFREAFRDGESAGGIETAMIKKDGSRMDVSCRARAVRDEEGTVVAVRVSLRDITAKKELSDRLDRILTGSRDGLWEWPDLSADPWWWSARTFQMLGYAPDEFQPSFTKYTELLHPTDRGGVSDRLAQAIADGGPFEATVRLLSKPGHYVWVEIKGEVYPGQGEGPTRASGSVRDITARQELEESLSSTTASLIEAQTIAGIGSWYWDYETGPGPASVEKYKIFGRDPEAGPPSPEEFLSRLLPEDAKAFRDAVEEARTSGVMELKYRARRWGDGEERVLQSRGRVVRDADGAPVGLNGVTMDVTDRQIQERVLEAERDRARQYLDTAEVMMVVLDRRGRIEMINRKGCETLGRSEADCLGRDWFDLAIPPDIRGAVRGMFDKVISGAIEPPIHYENPVINSAGERVPIAWYNSFLRDETGSIISALSSGTDLTELHQAQHALRDSQTRLEIVIDSMQAGVVLQDVSGEILYANEPAGQILGMAVSDVKGKDSHDPVWEMVDEDGEPVPGEEHPSMVTLRTGEPVRGALRGLFSGETSRIRWLLINTEPLFDPGSKYVREVVSTFLDITDRRKNEEALRESEERYRSLFTWMGEGFALKEILWDDAGEPYDYRFLEVNPAFERLTGFTRDGIVGRTFREVIPGFEPTWVRRYGEVVRTGGSILFSGFALPLSRHLDVQAFHLEGDRFAVTFNDVTDRVGSEKALQESESRFRGIFQDSPTGITLVGPDGKMVAVNPRFCEMLGYSEKELLGHDPDEFTHPYDLRLSARQTRELDTNVGSGWEDEKRYLKKDGSAVWCTLRTSQILDEQGVLKYSLGMIQDISPRRKAEADLVESEARLRALATRLATVREQERGAVSRELHDELGQALTVLRMDLSLLHGSVEKGEDLGKLSGRLEDLVSMSDTNIDLVRSISSRLRPPILDVLGLGPAIEWQIEEYGSRTKTQFHVDLSLESDEVSKGNATSLFRITQEALTNVLRHADASEVWVTLEKRDRWIELTIRDDGRGIERGGSETPTGLGLLGMEERATSMGGDLSVLRGPGGGTIVRARIPAGFGKGSEE